MAWIYFPVIFEQWFQAVNTWLTAQSVNLKTVLQLFWKAVCLKHVENLCLLLLCRWRHDAHGGKGIFSLMNSSLYFVSIFCPLQPQCFEESQLFLLFALWNQIWQYKPNGPDAKNDVSSTSFHALPIVAVDKDIVIPYLNSTILLCLIYKTAMQCAMQ